MELMKKGMARVKHVVSPSAVSGKCNIHTPRFVNTKNTELLNKTVPTFIFFKKTPMAVIAKNEMYTTGVIMEKPKKISVHNIASKGIMIAQCFLSKKVPANRATAVMGATFGGCGKSLTNIATKIKLTNTRSFLLNPMVLSSCTNLHFFQPLPSKTK